MHRVVLLLLLSSIIGISAHAAEQKQLKSYAVLSADTEVVADIVREIIGKDEIVVLDRVHGRLLITATEDMHKQIAEIIKEADVPPKNVRIEVHIVEVGEQNDSGVSVKTSGDASVSRAGTGYKVKFSPEVREQKVTQSSSVKEMLLVSSGHEAVLRVGAEVPFFEWLVECGRNWGYIRQGVEFRNVGAKLVVKPTVIGNGPFINVLLTPELSGLVDGRSQTVRYIQAATQVTVQDGQPLEIGGFGKSQEFYDRFLAGFGRSGTSRRISMTLIPHIVGAAGK